MNENLNNILQQLSNYTQNYAIGQIIAELHVVVERLEFVNFEPDKQDSKEELLSQIAYLLDRDLSSGITQFVRQLIDDNEVGILLGDKGRLFIGYCETYFSEKKQIIFKTAVVISKEMQRQIQARLMDIFPVSSRVVFESDPSVGAGFLIMENGQSVADYSLRSKMVKLLERRMREQIPINGTAKHPHRH